MNEEVKKEILPENAELKDEALDAVSGGATACDNIFFCTCHNCGKQYATGNRGGCPFCGAERNQQEVRV